MRIDFTRQEADLFLEPLKMDNDLVRLVDPVARRVEEIQGTKEPCDLCHELWGKCDRCENCASLRALRDKGQAYKMETRKQSTYWVYSRFMRIDGRDYVAEIAKDVTRNLVIDSDHEDQLGNLIQSYNHLLVTDSLTGVYNRRFLDEMFLPSLQCCREEQIEVNLAFLDLDDFKIVNDSYGHTVGDHLLKEVATFWQLHFNSRTHGKERLVVRFGGDEIIIIACGVPKAAFEEEIHRYYEEMRRVCYYSEQLHFHFDFTFGIASSKELGDDWTWEALMDLADHRMYDNKPLRSARQKTELGDP